MTKERLIELLNDGTIGELIKIGLVSPKIITQYEIYCFVEAKKKSRKQITLTQIQLEAELKFNIGRDTFYRSLKVFR